MIRTRLRLRPGQRGTKKLLSQYGSQLVCVRYRYDDELKKRYKTVELIVDEAPWAPKFPRISDEAIVQIKIGFDEHRLQEEVARAGGKWDSVKCVWRLRYGQVCKLKLKKRIVS